jgi:hypothetical protein
MSIQDQIELEAERAIRQIELRKAAELQRSRAFLWGFQPDLSECAEIIARTQTLGGSRRERQQQYPSNGVPLRVALGQLDNRTKGTHPFFASLPEPPKVERRMDDPRFLMSMPDYMRHTRPPSLTGRHRDTIAEIIEKRHQEQLEALRQEEIAKAAQANLQRAIFR